MKNLQDRIDQIEAKLSEATWNHREAVAKIYAETVRLRIEQVYGSAALQGNALDADLLTLVAIERYTAEQMEVEIVEILYELSCRPEAGEHEPEVDLTKYRYSFETGKYEAI